MIHQRFYNIITRSHARTFTSRGLQPKLLHHEPLSPWLRKDKMSINCPIYCAATTTATATTSTYADVNNLFLRQTSSIRCLSTNSKSKSKRPRSPYAILNLKTNATEQHIKAAFRKLAKQYHPDLNPNLSPDESQTKMAEIIQAYEQLMDDDFLGVRVGDGRVALACEMFTLDELRMDNLHDVYAIRIMFTSDDDNSDDSDKYVDDVGSTIGMQKDKATDTVSSSSSSPSLLESALTTDYIIDMSVHPEDSISDVKRQIQSSFEVEWGLEGRKMDRDKIRTGWEIVCKDSSSSTQSESGEGANENDMDGDNGNDNNNDGDDGDGDDDHDLRVMSYHLFVHSYGIKHGDIIHAVVRRY